MFFTQQMIRKAEFGNCKYNAFPGTKYYCSFYEFWCSVKWKWLAFMQLQKQCFGGLPENITFNTVAIRLPLMDCINIGIFRKCTETFIIRSRWIRDLYYHFYFHASVFSKYYCRSKCVTAVEQVKLMTNTMIKRVRAKLTLEKYTGLGFAGQRCDVKT